MKKLLPLLILIFAFTAFGHNTTSLNDWLSIDEFSIEDAGIKFAAAENRQADECAATLNPTSGLFVSGNTGGSLSVTIAGGCSWTAQSNVTWIHISSGSNGTGNGTVVFTVDANSGPARTGTVTIAGQTFTATQNSGCTFRFGGAYSLSTTVSYGPAGGQFTPTVVSPTPGCAGGWFLSGSDPWITISGATVIVAPNPGPSRTGYVRLSPGNIAPTELTIIQSGCTYTFVPANSTIPAAGGTVNLVTQSGCSLAATTDAPWLSITSNNSTTISLTAGANNGPARFARIDVGGQALSLYQIPGCAFSHFPSPDNRSVSAAAGTSSFNLGSETGCSWTAVSNASWITITSGSTGTNAGTVSFSFTANTGPARTGTITAGGQTFTLNQAGGQCSYSLSASSANIPAGGDNGTVNVTTAAGCNWSALSNVPWIITFASGNNTGSGTVTFSVEANTGPARTGTITIAGQNFTVTQANGCAYTLSSNSAFYPVSGGTGNFNIITAPGCAWTAQTSAYFITITSGASGVGNGTVTYTVPSNPSLVRGGTIEAAGQTFTVTQNENGPIQPPNRAAYDFDGDGKSDFSIYRPSVGEWWYLRSSDGGNRAFQFGTSTDKIVPADYTGDGKSDFAFYRKGEWFILRSEDFSYYAFPFGLSDDIPAPADYDGDRKADAAVFRPSNATWYILKSTGGVTIQQFGSPDDVPIPADYNGDGKADIATYNRATSTWMVLYGNSASIDSLFRENTAKPVPGDYTGDGKADVALYDTLTNEWYVVRSENQASYSVKFGTSGDIPASADYDGDGKTDFAIYRPSTGDWWYAASSANGQPRTRRFGISTDIPVPSAYIH